ncbi:low affinity immunoglobulin epsilon Fc receptor isoform X7 [Equus asinus]|uniref:low affinity immunoglobulin epsilon Fc receptor isoform X7 n=1 Tax=Equus asinus TaxID=9793 RepID=UPI0038F77CBD
MEEHAYSEFPKFPGRRRQCCQRGTLLALLGLVTTAMWAGLLTLLLLWHWETVQKLKQLEKTAAQNDLETVQKLKQLEKTAAQNVSQVSKDLERHKGEQVAQESQAAKMSQSMEKIQDEQNRMKSQDSELSRNLNGLREDLSDLQSQGLNERRAALHALDRLQEEVAKLWIELRVSNGTTCNTCPDDWVHFQKKCYYFGEGPKRWIQARFACSKLHGRLVSIHSQEEQDFLTRHANKKGSWIGLRDLNIEGEFVWMDQNPLDYSNWQPGEPNNGGQGEDCVMMRASGHWNDAFCGSYLDGWVCDRLVTC